MLRVAGAAGQSFPTFFAGESCSRGHCSSTKAKISQFLRPGMGYPPAPASASFPHLPARYSIATIPFIIAVTRSTATPALVVASRAGHRLSIDRTKRCQSDILADAATTRFALLIAEKLSYANRSERTSKQMPAALEFFLFFVAAANLHSLLFVGAVPVAVAAAMVVIALIVVLSIDLANSALVVVVIRSITRLPRGCCSPQS